MDQETDRPPDAPDWFKSQIQSPKLRSELINLARRKGVPADDCEDIASEAIMQAIRNQAKYDSGGDFFRRGSRRSASFSWMSSVASVLPAAATCVPLSRG
jgi:hypothetical protein